MASNLGTSVLTLKTDTKQFDAGMESAKKRMETVGASMQKVGAGLSAVGAGFALALSSVLESADKIGKASGAIGVDVERLQGWFYAAETAAGVSSDSMVKMFGKLSDAIDDAGSGGKTYGDIFKQMGIAVKDSEGNLLSADEVLLQLADRFAQGKVGVEEMAAVQGLLGGKMQALINLLKLGSEGVNGLITEAGKYGVMTKEQIAASEAFNDAMTRLGMAFKGLMFTFLDSEWMKWMTENVEAMALWVAETAKAHPWLVKLGLGIGAVSVVLGQLLIALGALVASLAAIKSALLVFGFLLTVKVWIVVVIGALLWFIATNETVQKVIFEVWNYVVDTFKSALDSIIYFLKSIVNFVVDSWKYIVKVSDQALKTIWNGIKNFWKLIVSVFDKSLKGILTGLDKSWGFIVKISLGAMDLIWRGTKKSWGFISRIIEDELTTIYKDVVRDWKLIVRVFDSAMKIISSGLEKSWDYIVRFIDKALTRIYKNVLRDWKTIVELFDWLMTRIHRNLTRDWNTIVKLFDSAWASIKNIVGSGIDWIKTKIKEFSGDFIGIFQFLSDAIVGNSIVPDMVKLIRGEFGFLNESLVGDNGIVKDTTQKISDQFNSSVTSVGNSLDKFGTEFNPKLKTNMTQMSNKEHLNKITGVAINFNSSVDSMGKGLAKFGTGEGGFADPLKSNMELYADKDYFGSMFREDGTIKTSMELFFSQQANNFDRFSETGDIGLGVKSNLTGIGTHFSGLNTVLSGISPILGSIKGGLDDMGDHGLKGLETITQSVGDKLGGWAGTLVTVLGKIKSIWTEIDAWLTDPDKLKKLLGGFKEWLETIKSVYAELKAIWKLIKEWINDPDKLKKLKDMFKGWYDIIKDVFGIITDLFKKGDDKKGNTFNDVIDIFKDLKDSIFGAKEQMDALNTAFLFFMGQAFLARYLGYMNIGFTVGGGGILSQWELRRIDASTFASAKQLNAINKNTSDLYESFEDAYGVGTTGILNDIRKNTLDTVSEVKDLTLFTAKVGYTNGKSSAEILWDISGDFEDLIHLTDVSLNNNGKSVAEYLSEQTGNFEDTQQVIEAVGVTNDEWLTKIEANTLKTANNTEKIKDDIAGGVQINQPITVTVGNPSAIRSSFTGVSAQSIGTSVTSGLSTVMARENTRLISAIKEALKKNTGGLRSSVKKVVSETS